MKTGGEFIRAGLDVIQRTDPDLYVTMDESGWQAYPADSAADIPVRGMERIFMEDRFPHAFGVTGKRNGASSIPGVTYVNVPYITEVSGKQDMPVDQFTAVVLAHEFDHYQGGNELNARAAGSDFACSEGIGATVCQYAQISELAAYMSALGLI